LDASTPIANSPSIMRDQDERPVVATQEQKPEPKKREKSKLPKDTITDNPFICRGTD